MMTLFLLGVSPQANAYRVYTNNNGITRRWVAGGTTLSVNTHSFPAGSVLHQRIDQAIVLADQANIHGSSFGLSHGDVFTLGPGGNSDDINIVAFDDLGPCENIPASTTFRYGTFNTWKIKEADILLNSNCGWGVDDFFDFNGPASMNNNLSPGVIVAHEVLHVASLNHTYKNAWGCVGFPAVCTLDTPFVQQTSTVGLSYDGGGAYDLGFRDRRYDIGEDDRRGIRFVYPGGSPARDLSVQSYYTPNEDSATPPVVVNCARAQGIRSRPSPRRDLLARAVAEGKAFGECPTDMTTNQQPALQLFPGTSLSVTFTFQNLGTTTETATYRYYLNSTPTAGGTVVASIVSTQSVNNPMEHTRTINIPAGISSGTYYLVVEADATNVVPESSESNNIAVWNRRIKIL